MVDSAIDILTRLGVLPAFQFMAIAAAAIFIFRYFTDRS